MDAARKVVEQGTDNGYIYRLFCELHAMTESEEGYVYGGCTISAATNLLMTNESMKL